VADQDDVRRIALALPGAVEEHGRFAFGVEKAGKLRAFVWTWRERQHPKRPKVPRPDVLVVRVRDSDEKAALLAGDPDRFFTEPHYDGYPMVLLRLPRVTAAELAKVVADAWRLEADAPAKPARSPRPRPRTARARRAKRR
jgi:hypothetical protein